MVEPYHRKRADGFELALAVQERFAFKVEGLPFPGYVDWIDNTTAGGTETEQKLGRDVGRLTLDRLPSQTSFEVARHGEEQVGRMPGMLLEAAGGIEAGAFELNPGYRCTRCDG